MLRAQANKTSRTRRSVRSLPWACARQRRRRTHFIHSLRSWIRRCGDIVASCRHRSRIGARQIWSDRLARSQTSDWHRRSTCGSGDTLRHVVNLLGRLRSRRRAIAGMTASSSLSVRAREVYLWACRSTWLFLLELLVNLARAEIDALDKQYAANEVESKIRDH